MRTPKHLNPACVLKVGHGRGFIIEHRVKISKAPPLPKDLKHISQTRVQFYFMKHRLVLTAAHCLPQFPKLGLGALDEWARHYKGLLGSLDGKTKDVWAECLFVDPVGDVAVLGTPDTQELGDQADAYASLTGDGADVGLVEDVPFLQIGTPRSGRGWVLSLDGRWVQSRLDVSSYIGRTSLGIDPTEPGQSGSPVLNDAGEAVGLISSGHESTSKSGKPENHRACQPILTHNLPGWLVGQ